MFRQCGYVTPIRNEIIELMTQTHVGDFLETTYLNPRFWQTLPKSMIETDSKKCCQITSTANHKRLFLPLVEQSPDNMILHAVHLDPKKT